MKAVIHAGAYKTATSGLQVYLHSNRDVLINEHRVLYPKTGARRNFGSLNHDSVSHNLLFRNSKATGEQIEPVKTALREEIAASNAASLLISAETLSLTTEREKKTFLALLTDCGVTEIRIVYSIRHFANFVESMANQILKNPLKELKEITLDGSPMPRDLRHWRRLVGADHLTTLYFDGSDYRGFVEEMVEALAFGDAKALESVADNTSVSLNTMQAVSMIGALIRESRLELDRHSRNRLLRALTRLETGWAIRERAIVLPRAQAVELGEAFAGHRDELAGFLTERSLARMDADLASRKGSTPKDRNIHAPRALGGEDLVRLVLFMQSVPELSGLVQAVLAGRQAAEA